MRNSILYLLACLAVMVLRADESIPLLVIKGQAYSNVTVTAVSATDLFFKHAAGLGNAKLKDLDPTLQAHFHFDANKSLELEKQRATNTFHYQQFLATNQAPAAQPKNPVELANEDDFVAPKVEAHSICGQRPPVFIVEKWLTRKPDFTGKFIMLVFWTTTSEHSRQAIPLLNSFMDKFHGRLAIVAISDEPEESVRELSQTPIGFSVAIDTQARMAQALEITAIPQCILVDPHAIVRYEGSPAYLDDEKLEHFLLKYQ